MLRWADPQAGFADADTDTLVVSTHHRWSISLPTAYVESGFNDYARVSTADQTFALQLDALRAAGCEQVFGDWSSGAKADRPGLAKAVAYVCRGDTLVTWKLDRLGRSMAHLIETVRLLDARGVGFRSLTQGVDTTRPGGTLVFHLVALHDRCAKG